MNESSSGAYNKANTFLGLKEYEPNGLLGASHLVDYIFISYGINTTKYWLRAIFKENELASSPLILHKANILWH